MNPDFDKKEAFLKAYDELGQALFRKFCFKISDSDRALDLVQETFMKAWVSIAEGKKEIRNIKSFLYTIANNLIIDEYRKKKTLSLDKLEEEEGFDPKGEGESEILRDLEVGNAVKAIEKLPEKYKEVITMRYVDGLSPQEIAEILGESENAVSVRLNRGVKKIKDLLRL